MSASDERSKTIGSLSPLEKAGLLSGKNTWQTRAIPRVGIRPIFLSDGPHGLRKQMGSGDHLGIAGSMPSTCFPTAATIANAWDPELAEKVGVALGQEAAHIGVDVILGPGLNIKRSPLGGRNFEYFSEDPYLAGKIAAGYVRGIQSQGIAACPKHFAVNSQETLRMTNDSIVDEATLREIYLTAFEIVVRESNPRTIMSSYNLINGTYANEHAQLLQQILRDEWGFDGAVITDWGGSNDPVAAIDAGGTLQMPSPGYGAVQQIMDAPEAAKAQLDKRVAEVIDLVQWIKPVETDESVFTKGHALAQAAAEQSLVLLKNDDNILPLAPATKVAVIGQFAFDPRYQGAGSSLVNPSQLIDPMTALDESSLDVVARARGFRHGSNADPQLTAEAVEAAKLADVVLLYLGLDGIAESEGKDRDHLRLPDNQVELLRAVSLANPNVVVVFAAGSAVEMPWLGRVKALVHGYLCGQAGAPAIVRALLGEVNPSGRLAETYPLSLDDTPTAGNFPGTGEYSLYREGPYVGYRYYSSADMRVQFPFGFGLSYTTFEYSDLEATPEGVTFTVTNTGAVGGADVPQVYVSAPAIAGHVGPRPTVTLAGFQKVELAPGESQRITVAFDQYSFRAFDAQADMWVTVGGEYVVSVGANVNDRPLQAGVAIEGITPTAAPVADIVNYSSANVHAVTDKEFAVLLGRPLPRSQAAGKPLAYNSPLRDLEYAKSPLGRAIYSQYFLRGLRKAERTGVPDLNLLFQYGMPFRSISNMSGGLADTAMVDGILTIVNGNFFKGLGQVIGRYFANRKRQKTLDAKFTELSEFAAETHPSTEQR